MSHRQEAATGSSSLDMTLARGCALILAVLGFLPIAQWLPGGLTDPEFVHRWTEWAYGLTVCAGSGIVCAILAHSRSFAFGAAWHRRRVRIAELTRSNRDAIDLGLAAGCFLLYAVIARVVYAGKPLLIDELIQVLQARMYVGGHLSLAVDSSPEFFSVLHVVDTGDRMYSQFPPGWATMLMLGVMTGTAWLVGPLCGGISVWIFAKLLRRTLPSFDPVMLVAGTALFGLAPFAAFQFGSHMSHGPVLMWLLIAILGLMHVTELDRSSAQPRTVWAFVTGVAGGCAFTVRPLDAMAFGIPAGAWLAWRTGRDRSTAASLGAAAAGLAIPVAVLMWVNLRTTGSPLEFGYTALWGSSHGLGFHASPWGDAHTPQRGLELVSAYVTRLNVYLFEAPFPSLLPVVAGLLLLKRLSELERYLFAGTVVHAILYFAYWHDGFFLGPRFVVPWLPLMIIACVRLGDPRTWRAWARPVRAGAVGALGAAFALTAVVSLPARITQYRADRTSMRQDYTAEAARAGVSNALVFVRESWGAQLVARLWALGVSRRATAELYANVDACVLEHAITRVERASLRGTSAEGDLRALMRDSARVRPSSVSPDTTERMLPGERYDATCRAHVVADREGYALFPPLLLEQQSGNVYVRDFQERDTLILRRYPTRRAYLLRRDGVDGASPLRWIRLSADARADTSQLIPR